MLYQRLYVKLGSLIAASALFLGGCSLGQEETSSTRDDSGTALTSTESDEQVNKSLDDLSAKLLLAGMDSADVSAIVSEVKTEYSSASLGFWATSSDATEQAMLRLVAVLGSVIAKKAESSYFSKLIAASQSVVVSFGVSVVQSAFEKSVVVSVKAFFPKLASDFSDFSKIAANPDSLMAKARQLKDDDVGDVATVAAVVDDVLSESPEY